MSSVDYVGSADHCHGVEQLVRDRMVTSTADVLDWRSASIPADLPVILVVTKGEGLRKFRDVISEARKVAMSDPLGRNVKPEYSTDGKPCCIFGHVLERLGVPVAAWELERLGYNNWTFADLSWEDWGFEPPNAYQRLWVTHVQANTDNGDSWILGIAMADATPM